METNNQSQSPGVNHFIANIKKKAHKNPQVPFSTNPIGGWGSGLEPVTFE
jgi:hypothetical protein